MKRSPKFQWVAFSILITTLAGVIGLIAHATWSRLSELRRDLRALQAESFHMADHLEAVVLDMNEAVLRFDAHGTAAEVERFNARAAELESWMDSQKANLNTLRERELLEQVRNAFRTYRERVGPWLRGKPAELAGARLLDALEREAAPYVRLCRQFDEAQQWSLAEFSRQSHEAVALLQRLLVVAAVLLIAFWAVVTASLYRAMVAPLRARLVEARGMIERQEKLASLGTLAAGVAHEIRNPLTAIKVRLHSLRRTLSRGSSEQEDASVIGAEIQRLERIVKDFLQFARPSEPQFIVTTADAVLQHIHQFFRAQLESSGVEIRLQPSPTLRVRVDPQQMEQVLINLVQNAAESIEQRGAVTLRAFSTRAQIRGRATAAVALEVSDTGKGIPPAVQKRLFDPFFTTKAAGTGLGLSIAARIVESHGGALQYRSEVNRGTIFRVLLPAVQADES